ncbi:MAG TPA: NAD-dependent epimerase/dehydratase family protein [Vicinamibacteria bacterium]|nr:NAD-dependent epimerase/dehydratase family protein [Vicinamibacteria bacterium]
MMSGEGALAGARVLVTGGCGFIGSHLVRRLLAEGVAGVAVVDSFRYGRPDTLAGLGARVRLVRHDLGQDRPEALRDVLAGTDAVFHFAAEKHHTQGTALDVLRTNVAGTSGLLQAAQASGVGKVVFASSVFAYGRRQGPPLREDEPARPTTAYGMSKLLGERLLGHFGAPHGPAHVTLRYFFVYGPRQHLGLGYKSVIVKTYERLLRGERPTVHGDGQQALDYVFVDDAVEAALAALRAGRSGAVYNVGSGAATPIDDLVDRMMRVAGRILPKEYLPPDETAGSCRVADLARTAAELGWRPRVDLDEGLSRTWRWMRESAAA